MPVMPFSEAEERRAYRRLLAFLTLTQPAGALLGGLYTSYFFLYATDTLLIAPAAIGVLIAIARVYDGATDLLIGHVSDRSTGRFGRRRPFILAGALFVFAAIGLWQPPMALRGLGLVLFVGAMLLLFETGRSMVSVPIGALGVEVARTPKRRTFTNILAGLMALGGTIGALLLMQWLIDSGDARTAGAGLFVGLPIFVACALMIATPFLREVPLPQQGRERGVVTMLREVLSVGYHRQLISVQMAEAFAYTSIGFAAPYLMRYVLGAPERTSLILIVFFVAWHVSPLAWLQLVPRLGMRRVWMAGQYLWLVAFATVPLIFVFGVPALIAGAAIGGIATGASAVSYAMLGDLADYDARQSGRQRQGIYMTVYLLVGKIAGALVAFLLGWMLQLAGFVPNAEQGTAAIAAMVVAASLFPALAMAGGIRLLRRYHFYEREGVDDGRRARPAPLAGVPAE